VFIIHKFLKVTSLSVGLEPGLIPSSKALLIHVRSYKSGDVTRYDVDISVFDPITTNSKRLFIISTCFRTIALRSRWKSTLPSRITRTSDLAL
jgi:hypothetical protein